MFTMRIIFPFTFHKRNKTLIKPYDRSQQFWKFSEAAGGLVQLTLLILTSTFLQPQLRFH